MGHYPGPTRSFADRSQFLGSTFVLANTCRLDNWLEGGPRFVGQHVQDHGVYPRRLYVRLGSTTNIRTGGDDVRRLFTLMKLQPQWDERRTPASL